MHTTRRDLMKFVAGSAVGALFTPAPWRLITDTALWSENWPGIPRPAHGEIKTKFTNCALCPAGCAVRARCVGEQPVSLAGVPAHPLSHGALCPFGLAGHHLPYHPERLRQGDPQAAVSAVTDAAARCGANERIAVLDLSPGRTASWTYRRAMAGVKNGLYLTSGPNWAVDLTKARTVISFGVPVLDGWGTPGNVLRARENFRLVQVEPLESHTAALADEWLNLQPDAQAALAIVKERAAGEPALVLGDDPQILALNQVTGAWGKLIVPRQDAPVPASWKKAVPSEDLASVPDASIRILLIDESAAGDYIPWNAIEKKLVRDNPVVVTFAWSRAGYGRHAQFVLPTAVYPEMTGDIPPAIDSPAAAFRLSTPLLAPPAGVVNPSDFIARLAGLDAANALRERAGAIHASRRGMLFTYADGKSTPVKEIKPDDFWKELNEGACWLGDPAPAGQVGNLRPMVDRPGSEPTVSDALPLTVALTETHSAPLVSPLLSKLYQESNLRLGRNCAALHPDSARMAGVEDGARAVLETGLGRCAIQVTLDPSIPPGIVQVAAGAEVLDICGAFARARVVRA